jgi:hypothetical protein
VKSGANLGTKSAPFLGSYRFMFGFASVLAPAVAAGVLLATARGRFENAPWATVLVLGWAGSFVWALSLAVVDGAAGLTRSLEAPGNYLNDVPQVGDSVLSYLGRYVEAAPALSNAARGHPPGPVVLLWSLERLGITDRLTIGLLVTALGAAVTPFVLAAMRGVCGEAAARRFAPVLMIAPYAVWVSVSVDVVVALLGAAMVAMGVRASDRGRRGWRAGAWALACGVTLGVAALCSYAAPWLGLSAVCLYFARRRAWLNAVTGLGALLPVLLASLAGFTWLDGLMVARDDYAARVEPGRSALAWSAISVVVLLLAAGPPLVPQPAPGPQHARLAVPHRGRRGGRLLDPGRPGPGRGRGGLAAVLPVAHGGRHRSHPSGRGAGAEPAAAHRLRLADGHRGRGRARHPLVTSPPTHVELSIWGVPARRHPEY